jgi:hypothetical protein
MARFIAHGTTVEFASATVGGLTGFGSPDRSKGDVEVTDGESAFDREYIPGLREGGSITLEGRYDPEDEGQEALNDNYESDQDTETVFIQLPARAHATMTVKYRFVGYVNSFSQDLPQDADDAATFSATIKVAGPVEKIETAI